MTKTEAVEQFAEMLSSSLAEDTFVRMSFARPMHAEDGLEKVLVRLIGLSAGPHLSFTFRYPTRDVTKNLPIADGIDWVRQRIGREFRSALLCTTKGDWQFSTSKSGEGRLVSHKPSVTHAPSRSHDEKRSAILDESAQDWLHALGVTDASGKVRERMADKYRQINRYLEILRHLAKDCGWLPEPGKDKEGAPPRLAVPPALNEDESQNDDRPHSRPLHELHWPRALGQPPYPSLSPSEGENVPETGEGVVQGVHTRSSASEKSLPQMTEWPRGFSETSRGGEIAPPQIDRRDSSKLVLADMGCGKGYLTFGAWHLFRRILGKPVRVVGVEARQELVDFTSKLAMQIGAESLELISGTIESVPLSRVDALIALHACNTATDHAILRGIELGARLILVAPCCHKELRPQIAQPTPFAPILRHGVMEERMAEWVTDGLRALFLEWAGYRTKVFEFVSVEHTAKNLMISAVRERAPFDCPAARDQILELKSFFGIRHHALDALLEKHIGARS